MKGEMVLINKSWDEERKQNHDKAGVNLTENDLGIILREMYENAPVKEQTTFIHLFGIKFAGIIKYKGYSVKDIVKISGIGLSYQTEVSKGIRLSKYVAIKDARIKD